MIPQQDAWLHPPERLLLLEDEVHVWRADLNQETSIVRALSDILTTDERLRAEKYFFQRDRDHFIVARGALRLILSRYLKTPPHQIQFSYNQYGKPALDGETGERRLRFNVSHSHEVALYAIALGCEVGIDIELINEAFARMEIAEQFFSPREISTLRALKSDQRSTAFFNCWTRKEAYIKALGEGLSHPLKCFAVSLVPGEQAEMLSIDQAPQEAARWSLIELNPGQDYVAALAVEGFTPTLHRWQWLWERRSEDLATEC